MSSEKSVHILRVDSSAQHGGSVSRRLTETITNALRDRHPGAVVTERDVARGVPFVDETVVAAMFTPEAARTPAQREALSVSDTLIRELLSADYLVLGVPMYNLGVPATFKAYFDQIVRSGVTFTHSAEGMVGLVSNVRTAYVVVTSGEVPFGSPADFVSGYVRLGLEFLGVKDIEIVDATQLRVGGESRERQAAARVKELLGA